jgi:hypothetical protein
VELHVIRVVSTPRRNRRRLIFGARTHISRVNRTVASANVVPLQFIAAFLDAANARCGTGTSERAAPHGREKSLALQYVMPRTKSIRVRRLTTKKIFNR